MRKETLKEVNKGWGKELIIVNDIYCGKLLYLDKGAESSYHKHLQKQETFFCLEGQVALTIEGKDYMLNPFSRPKTIRPKTLHSFRGITDAVIIEFSTHHEESDVVRLTESKPARPIIAEGCPKLDNCPKITMVLDKDMLDFQYAEAVRAVCAKCQERGENEQML